MFIHMNMIVVLQVFVDIVIQTKKVVYFSEHFNEIGKFRERHNGNRHEMPIEVVVIKLTVIYCGLDQSRSCNKGKEKYRFHLFSLVTQLGECYRDMIEVDGSSPVKTTI